MGLIFDTAEYSSLLLIKKTERKFYETWEKIVGKKTGCVKLRKKFAEPVSIVEIMNEKEILGADLMHFSGTYS